MTEPISINLTGTGDHTVVAAEARTWITLLRVMLTVSTPDNTSLKITGKSGSEIRLGPFYMLNGGTLSFAREENMPLMRVDVGQPLVIEIEGSGTLGGTLIIERGQV